jgi:hypothetical protein
MNGVEFFRRFICYNSQYQIYSKYVHWFRRYMTSQPFRPRHFRAVSSSFCHSLYLFCGLPYFLVVETRAAELNRFFLLPASTIPVCHLTDHSHLKGPDKVVGVEIVSSLNCSLKLDICTCGIYSGTNRHVIEWICWCGAKRNLIICTRGL